MKCPHCNEHIDKMVFFVRQDIIKSLSMQGVEPDYDIEDYLDEELDGGFQCPLCDTVITKDEEEAQAMLADIVIPDYTELVEPEGWAHRREHIHIEDMTSGVKVKFKCPECGDEPAYLHKEELRTGDTLNGAADGWRKVKCPSCGEVLFED